jgi:DNA-binding MarR family transcriptional regulator
MTAGEMRGAQNSGVWRRRRRSRYQHDISQRDMMTAEQLLTRHNSAVGLAARLVAQSLMVRERIPENRRKVQLLLTAKGEQVLARMAAIHRRKLRRLGPEINRMFEGLTGAWRGRP